MAVAESGESVNAKNLPREFYAVISHADLGDCGMTYSIRAVCDSERLAEKLRLDFIARGYPSVNIDRVDYFATAEEYIALTGRELE